MGREEEEKAGISATWLNPYLIENSPFDFFERNIRGFWEHPALSNVDKCSREQVLAKVLGFRIPLAGSEESSPLCLVLPAISGLLMRCKTLEEMLSSAEYERETALAEQETTQAELNAVIFSKSWRFTKPIRSFVAAMKSIIHVSRSY